MQLELWVDSFQILEKNIEMLLSGFLDIFEEHLKYVYVLEVTNQIGYTDADMAGDVDSRKSTSGYMIVFSGGAVSW